MYTVLIYSFFSYILTKQGDHLKPAKKTNLDWFKSFSTQTEGSYTFRNIIFPHFQQGEPGRAGAPGYRGDEGATGPEVGDIN